MFFGVILHLGKGRNASQGNGQGNPGRARHCRFHPNLQMGIPGQQGKVTELSANSSSPPRRRDAEVFGSSRGLARRSGPKGQSLAQSGGGVEAGGAPGRGGRSEDRNGGQEHGRGNQSAGIERRDPEQQ